MAFTGHALTAFDVSIHFTGEDGYLNTRIQGPLTMVNLWYYFSKFDHIFSVPALFFLYLGMKGLYRSSIEEEEV